MSGYLLLGKKQIFIIIGGLVGLCMILGFVLVSQSSLRPRDLNTLVIIDPGHGSIDPGCHHDGILEKEINLQISWLLKEELERANFQVVMTRTEDRLYQDDRNKDIRHRYQLANELNADIFLSIHVNKYPSAQPAGAQTFYYSEDGKQLAAHIQQALKDYNPINNRSIKRGDFLVLKNIDAPGVIVEVGFISNPEDRKRITNPQEQQAIARATTRGLISYLRQRDFTPGEGLEEDERPAAPFVMSENLLSFPVYLGKADGNLTSLTLQLKGTDVIPVVTGDKLIEKLAYLIIDFVSTPPAGLISPLPPGSRLLSAELKQNTLYLNFNDRLQSGHWKGTSSELLTVECLERTFLNFPAVDRVILLIDGQAESIGGHIFP